MPTHDEHGVRNTHLSRITQFAAVCPAEVGHACANHESAQRIPPGTINPGSVKDVTRSRLSLPHPAEGRLDLGLLGLR